mgnify:CR=1 FL=1
MIFRQTNKQQGDFDMQKFSCKLFLLTILFIFGIISVSQAVPMLPSDQPIFFQFTNMEQIDQSLTNSINVPGGYGTAGNWGLFHLSSMVIGGAIPNPPNDDIQGGGVDVIDFDGPGGTVGSVTGIFYGINLIDGFTANGGSMDFYWNEPANDIFDQNSTNGVTYDPNAAAVAAFTAGTFLGRIDFTSGIETGDPNVFLRSNSDVTTTSGLSGFSDAFGDVNTSVVGAWTDALNGNWFYTDEDGDGNRGEAGEIHDIRFSTFFNALADWDGVDDIDTDGDGESDTPSIRGLRSNDPGRAYTAVIPEPTTFFLFGAGLLGFAGVMRRKSS